MKFLPWSVVCATFYLSGCQSTTVAQSSSSLYKGENLIIPFASEFSGWPMLKQDKGSYHSTLRKNPNDPEMDIYAVSVTNSETRGTEYFRHLVDQPGFDNCQSFTSDTLKHPKSHFYPLEYWQTVCKRQDGQISKILQLMIQGNEAFYHIQKVWNGQVSAAQISQWRQRFDTIYVCDARSQSAPCPKE